MGYGLSVYSVDAEKVRAAYHSGDDKLRKMISGRFKDRIYSTNEDLGWSNERGEPSVFEALRHLIMGGEMNLEGAMYGYAYEYIVKFYGTFLDNHCFMPCSSEYFTDTLTKNLKATGVSLDLSDLSISYGLISFPPPFDFPGYGYWSADEVKKNLPILEKAENLTEENELVLSWLKFAAPRNEAIVGFWS